MDEPPSLLGVQSLQLVDASVIPDNYMFLLIAFEQPRLSMADLKILLILWVFLMKPAGSVAAL